MKRAIPLLSLPSQACKITSYTTKLVVSRITPQTFTVLSIHSQARSDKAGYTLAITNSTNAANAAAYYLPTLPLISGARPSCDDCTQQLFAVYDIFASNKTLEISQNYLQAAQVVNLSCGAGFVSLGKQIVSAGLRMLADQRWLWSLPGLGMAFIF